MSPKPRKRRPHRKGKLISEQGPVPGWALQAIKRGCPVGDVQKALDLTARMEARMIRLQKWPTRWPPKFDTDDDKGEPT